MLQRTLFSFCLFFSFFISHSLGQTLVIYDEFDSTHLNTSIWRTQQDWGPHINAELDKQIFRPQNVILEDGKLKLFLKEEPGCYDTWRFCDPSACDTNCTKKYRDTSCSTTALCQKQGEGCLCLVPKHFKYTAGMLVSKNKFHYGIFEMKCKIPEDCVPAFWLYGDCCSEIDIFEFLGCEEDNATVTIHKCLPKDCSSNRQCGKNLKELKKATRHNFSTGFYTWKLDWSAEGISISVEGKVIYRCKAKGLNACLYNTFNLKGGNCTIGTQTLYPNGMMNLIVNIATNPGKCIPAVPAALEIEYIKVWQYPQ